MDVLQDGCAVWADRGRKNLMQDRGGDKTAHE